MNDHEPDVGGRSERPASLAAALAANAVSWSASDFGPSNCLRLRRLRGALRGFRLRLSRRMRGSGDGDRRCDPPAQECAEFLALVWRAPRVDDQRLEDSQHELDQLIKVVIDDSRHRPSRHRTSRAIERPKRHGHVGGDAGGECTGLARRQQWPQIALMGKSLQCVGNPLDNRFGRVMIFRTCAAKVSKTGRPRQPT